MDVWQAGAEATIFKLTQAGSITIEKMGIIDQNTAVVIRGYMDILDTNVSS